jgi:hypothetical protein
MYVLQLPDYTVPINCNQLLYLLKIISLLNFLNLLIILDPSKKKKNLYNLDTY